MATYVSLVTITQRGSDNIKKTVDRANDFRDTAEKAGATVRQIYWTMGGHDGVIVFDAADDETASMLMLNLASIGAVHTQTMRAFDDKQMQAVLDRMP